MQFLFVNSFNGLIFFEKPGSMIDCGSIKNVVAWSTHGLEMMASDKFSGFGPVISLLLRDTSDIGLVFERNGIYGYAVVKGIVSDEPLLMGAKDLRIFINHAA